MRQWLIDIRNGQKLTQAAVAEKANISQPAFCDIERGVNDPKPETAMRIAEVLGFDWTRFYK